MTTAQPTKPRVRRAARLWKYRYHYLMFLPVFAATFLFFYLPMGGIRFAFYRYTPFQPPSWVGWANFEKLLFQRPAFWTAFRNTLTLSLTNLALSMLCSVTLSLLINEIKNRFLKRAMQTIVYLPHFLSWVVVASVFYIILSPGNNPATSGLVNAFLTRWGLVSKPIFFLADARWWTPVYLFISRWKETGWGTVIFLATLTSISPDLYEAAQIDGAGRWRQCLNVTIPAMMNTFVVVLILNLSKVMNLFESVLVLQNDRVLRATEVLQTYVYHQGIVAQSAEYGYPTAVGLFRSVVACALVLICNTVSKRVNGRGII
ncbi:MAG: ABC transporter permease subunit [Oscillospiraceae bacterium]|jgi:putative aldouronate transport system permease protein|nr:ABC transporter permease subunit [Oscillospiraceae bacterium]